MSRIVEVMAPEFVPGWTQIVVPDELTIDQVHAAILAGHPWPQVQPISEHSPATYIKPSTIVALRVR